MGFAHCAYHFLTLAAAIGVGTGLLLGKWARIVAVRGFDPNGGPIAPLRRADLWLLLTLVGCTVVLLALGMQ